MLECPECDYAAHSDVGLTVCDQLVWHYAMKHMGCVPIYDLMRYVNFRFDGNFYAWYLSHKLGG